MEFDDEPASSNVEDRRGIGPVGFGGIGPGGIAILVIGHFLGVDPSQLLGLGEQVSAPSRTAAAAAIGDDRLQRESQGYAVPDSFTHGSPEQRVRGIAPGRVEDCNSFPARSL